MLIKVCKIPALGSLVIRGKDPNQGYRKEASRVHLNVPKLVRLAHSGFIRMGGASL